MMRLTRSLKVNRFSPNARVISAMLPRFDVAADKLKARVSEPTKLPAETVATVPSLVHKHLATSAGIHLLNGFSTYGPSTRVLEAIFDRTMETAYTKSKAQTSESNAFFVVDLDRVVTKFEMWTNYLPRVVPHYAVKANPNVDIVRTLAAMGSSFDCATMAEIKHVINLGVDPSRIIFANPCKPMSHIIYAKEKGVLRTTFDSESELAKIKVGHPGAHLVLRLWVDDRDAQCPLSNKYGAKVSEATNLLLKAKELGLQVVGVSFHCGSGASAATYRSAMRDAAAVFKAGIDVGFPMKLLDIGGGMPGTESQDGKGPSLKTIASILNPMLKEAQWRGVEVIAEPGRYFCAEAQTLAVQIIGKRVRDNLRTYYVNDGLYQSFNCILYDHSILLPEDEKMDSGFYESSLFGQTCDGFDQISTRVLLPDLKVGDWMIFPSMGAYTNGASSNFNGFDLSNAVALDPTSLPDSTMNIFHRHGAAWASCQRVNS